MVKILVVGDLHGVKPQIHFKDFDCIIQPGDVCGSDKIRKMYKKYFRIIDVLGEFAPSFEEFADMEFGSGGHDELVEESMVKGREIIEYLNSFGVPVFIVPGNWDNSYGKTRIKNMEKNDYNYDKTWVDWWLGKSMNKKLVEGLDNIYDCQFSCYEFEGVNFVGFGNTSGPEKLKERLKKGKYGRKDKLKLRKKVYELYGRLEGLFRVAKGKPVVYISHNVPYGKMDKVIEEGSYANGKHAGSTVSKEMIMKYQPLVCVGGHIHEWFGRRTKMGKTTVLNAGFGHHVNTLIDIDEKKGRIRSVKFWDGKKLYSKSGQIK
ncbi:MAG: metallophosphoesterase [Nanoarchaeota archaeon]|jgi:Icc-related predicted phosphoesterase|nr:metallophosphoesterase [Nanoarchaeota archaeon]